MFDVILEDVRIVDGTGEEVTTGSVAVADGAIVDVGSVTGSARRTLRGAGLTVAPGFIDMHSHVDWSITSFPQAASSLLQGVTSGVVGNCGYSVAPVGSASPTELRDFLGEAADYLSWEWNGFGEWLDLVDAVKPGVNILPLIGHGMLRLATMGFEARPPSAGEQEEMERQLAVGLDKGAWGMSSGLVYSPGSFARPDEIHGLAHLLATESALYASHMRSETEDLFEAVEETIGVGEATGVRVHISHLKAAGGPNLGRMSALIARIEEARRRGIDVSTDFYPYSASFSWLSQLFPAWTREGGPPAFVERLTDPEVRRRIRAEYEAGAGEWSTLFQLSKRRGWDHVLLVVVSENSMRRWEGSTIAEAADSLKVDPFEFCCDLLVADRGRTMKVSFVMSPDDVNAVASWPVSVVGTDGVVLGDDGNRCHPRTWGTFPRLLRWVREGRIEVTLAELIRRMTSQPAQLLGLEDRGRIKPGLAADLVVFDAERIADRAEYLSPAQAPEGINYVMVNGVVTVDEGELSEERGGQVLKRAHRRI